MKSFDRIFCIVLVLIAAVFAGANILLFTRGGSESGRPYRVEINRAAAEIRQNGLDSVDLKKYEYVTNVEKYVSGADTLVADEETDREGREHKTFSMADFYKAQSDYALREINGEIYRFDYMAANKRDMDVILLVNGILAFMAIIVIGVMVFARRKILQPFEELKEVPYQLSKGNLSVPMKENKSRFFGRFVWGVDLLRENMEEQRRRELELQKENKTLLLSLSHDVKTPLSAIKLYAKALSKGLYEDKEKQLEIAGNINAKADEIENYVSQIISASREDFLSLNVEMGEFYLSELVKSITAYYSEKLALIQTNFIVEKYTDCLLKGDFDRSVEVLQNLMENAIKYGDGTAVAVGFSEEEDCLLISVKNSGAFLADTEISHIFESFWRGSNVGNISGSGLGLYICRQLMHNMGGEIFASCAEGEMCVTAVFGKV